MQGIIPANSKYEQESIRKMFCSDDASLCLRVGFYWKRGMPRIAVVRNWNVGHGWLLRGLDVNGHSDSDEFLEKILSRNLLGICYLSHHGLRRHRPRYKAWDLFPHMRHAHWYESLDRNYCDFHFCLCTDKCSSGKWPYHCNICFLVNPFAIQIKFLRLFKKF